MPADLRFQGSSGAPRPAEGLEGGAKPSFSLLRSFWGGTEALPIAGDREPSAFLQERAGMHPPVAALATAPRPAPGPKVSPLNVIEFTPPNCRLH